jgi:Predicted membrane protein (DUF2142)
VADFSSATKVVLNSELIEALKLSVDLWFATRIVSLDTMQDGENEAGSELPLTFSESLERKIILLLCALASLHVFVFSAAFPFFNNVDERIHFDLVLKYSHGYFPRGREMISQDSADYLALMNSHAYFTDPNTIPGGKLPPPLWTEPGPIMRDELEHHRAVWLRQENYEVSQPPLYYTLTGAEWHAGQRLRMDGRRLVYWLRFFNIAVVVVLVWLGYLAARIVFPGNRFARLGVPALLAFMPQTAFYSIGNDTLPALCFGITFICLLKSLSSEKPTALLGAVTGLGFAATYLSKLTTLPLLAIVATAVLFKMVQDIRRRKFRTTLPAFIGFVCCAGPPVIGWMIWCKSNFGDLTGSKLKMEHFGWTVKPLGDWWHHPVFTPSGLWTYLSGNMNTFWQGEFVWHTQPLFLPGTSAVYTILSLSLLVIAFPGLFRRFSNEPPLQRQALQLSMACFAAMLGFFAWLSVIYDFHKCPYPSREHPYFTSGRLLLGALIPFLLLIAYGLDRILHRFGNAVKFLALAAMVSAMLIIEIITDWEVFSNEYNWFHLP